MKRYLALMTIALTLSLIGGHGGTAAKQNTRVLSLCELVGNWKNYNRHKVRVRAIYEVGAEQTWLYDPACKNGEALTDVSFRQRVNGAAKRLDQIVAKDRRAWVILEGVFYGPEPFENIDPKLPTLIKERLEKSHKRYGHMGSFDTMIEVTRVVKAGQATDDASTRRE